MSELLIHIYPWIKCIHLIFAISWISGLLYLPRLFVYHADLGKKGSDLSETLKIMEYRLIKYIMIPAMYGTIVFGIILLFTPGIVDLSTDGWIHVKLTLVVILILFHFSCDRWRKAFAVDENKKSGKFFRLMNEVPTVLMIGIVIFVIVKPF